MIISNLTIRLVTSIYPQVCGARLGLTTEQMVEVRRLDERHREDRRRLGLPDILPPVTTGVKQRPGGGGRRKQASKDEGAGVGLVSSKDEEAGVGLVVRDRV